MHIRRLSFRIMAYAWAAPNTFLGLAVGLVMLCLGGQLRLVAGVAEFHGGWLVSRHEKFDVDNGRWNITKSPCQSKKEPSCRASQAKARTQPKKSSMP